MMVRVRTVELDPTDFIIFKDADVTWDTHTLQVTHGVETTTFPLHNVISFTTSDSGTP